MSGAFVAVVGPSGAGKDSLIAAARERLAADPRVVFVRRAVTRPEGGNEDHACLDEPGFAAALAEGAFVLSWRAHGLGYGIPSAARDAVADGRIAVANLSRRAVDDARRLFPRLSVVVVSAPPEVLARRLAGRGREDPAEIAARLAREQPVPAGPGVTVIDNGGALADAADAFVRHLRTLAGDAGQ